MSFSMYNGRWHSHSSTHVYFIYAWLEEISSALHKCFFSLCMMTEDWVISSHMYFLSVCWQKTVTPYAYVFYICMTTWVRVIFQHKWFISRFMIIVMHVWWLETVSFLNICAYYLCMSTWDRVILPYMKLFLYILCFYLCMMTGDCNIFPHIFFLSIVDDKLRSHTSTDVYFLLYDYRRQSNPSIIVAFLYAWW